MNRHLRVAPLTSIALVMSLSLRAEAEPVSAEWQKSVSALQWVAYSPTGANPDKGIEPPRNSIRADLVLLRKTGFEGLVTYGAGGILGKELPQIAESVGFRGVILGVWDPKSGNEVAAAVAAGRSRIVLGYCLGNEGLDARYSMPELSAAMQRVRTSTRKPVTTAEQLNDYESEDVRRAGDWVFPTVHPYFAKQIEPTAAARWTADAYRKLTDKSDRFVWFKEVGLPTAGDPQVSEESQDRYYAELAKTPVRFVYFEAFDVAWKTHLPVEPHWGIFRADRTPKPLGTRLLASPRPARSSSGLPR